MHSFLSTICQDLPICSKLPKPSGISVMLVDLHAVHVVIKSFSASIQFRSMSSKSSSHVPGNALHLPKITLHPQPTTSEDRSGGQNTPVIRNARTII